MVELSCNLGVHGFGLRGFVVQEQRCRTVASNRERRSLVMIGVDSETLRQSAAPLALFAVGAVVRPRKRSRAGRVGCALITASRREFRATKPTPNRMHGVPPIRSRVDIENARSFSESVSRTRVINTHSSLTFVSVSRSYPAALSAQRSAISAKSPSSRAVQSIVVTSSAIHPPDLSHPWSIYCSPGTALNAKAL